MGAISPPAMPRGSVTAGHRFNSIGGLVGANAGDITASYFAGSVTTGSHAYSTGGLVGFNSGTISASYATGSVTAGYITTNNTGGLVGENNGDITASYATGTVTGKRYVGGLVGRNNGTISAGYATGSVTAGGILGGLVGANDGDITASYSTGSVTGKSSVHGLVGIHYDGSISASYWDTQTSGQSTSAGGVGKTTTQLQSPTGYTGIYADWNLDLDGDGIADDPWDFGTSSQYPALNIEGVESDQGSSAPPTPASPTNLTAEVNADGQVVLSWAASDDATITGYRVLWRDRDEDAIGQLHVLVEDTGSAETGYTDRYVTPDARYAYRVMAINALGVGDPSGPADVDVPGPPARPQGLTATVVDGKVRLTWDNPEDSSITGYRIWRRNLDVDAVGQFHIVEDDTGSAETAYVDESVEPNTASYGYRVTAMNAAGESHWSSFARVDTPGSTN